MNTQSIIPLFATDKLAETREFYTTYLGFEVSMESDEYLGMRLPGENIELGFMPSCDMHPLGTGAGLLYCFNVKDIAAEYAQLEAKSAPVDGPPADMPWGDRKVCLTDPNGITVYIAQRVAAMDCAGEMS